MMTIFLCLIHWWYYQDDGEGLILCDIFSKIFQGIASVTMSILLIMMASGWKLNYKDLDFDEGMDVYLPVTFFILLVEILLAILTFSDIDAFEKYHDFAGVQGWCLVILKTLVFAWFAYCIRDTRE